MMRSCLMAFFALLLTACSSTIRTEMLMPAYEPRAADLPKVLVLPFDGPEAEWITGLVETLLAGIRIDGRQNFTVIERERAQEIVARELSFTLSSRTTPEGARDIGRLTAADAIYSGEVHTAATKDGSTYKKDTRCKEYRKENGVDTCILTEDFTEACVTRLATVAFTVRLQDARTGRMLFSRQYTGNANSKACTEIHNTYGREMLKPATDAVLENMFEFTQQLKKPADLLKEASKPAIEEFRKTVAPYTVTVEIRIMKADTSLPDGEMRNKFKHAVDLAEHEKLDKACLLWEELLPVSPKSAPLLYDLGICAEAADKLDTAMERYEAARKALGKPDSRVEEAIRRVRKNQEAN